MTAVGLLSEEDDLDEETVKEKMSGNLCRCGAYPGITAAILEVAR